MGGTILGLGTMALWRELERLCHLPAAVATACARHATPLVLGRPLRTFLGLATSAASDAAVASGGASAVGASCAQLSPPSADAPYAGRAQYAARNLGASAPLRSTPVIVATSKAHRSPPCEA